MPTTPGWEAAIEKLSGILEQQRERMIGMEMATAAAQMTLIARIAEQMGLLHVWGFPIRVRGTKTGE